MDFFDDGTLLSAVPLRNGVASYNVDVVNGPNEFKAVFSGADGGSTSSSESSVNVVTDGPRILGLSRLGLNTQPTMIVLRFDQPLSAASAENPANFFLSSPSGYQYQLAFAI